MNMMLPVKEKKPRPSELEQAYRWITHRRPYEPCWVCNQTGWFYNWEYRPDETTNGLPGAPCQTCDGKGWV